MQRMRRAAFVTLGALTIVGAVGLWAGSAPAASPAGLLTAVSSGLVEITARCGGDSITGSGFLVGPRVVMTARHVLYDGKGRPCTARVIQEGTGKAAVIARFIGLRDSASGTAADIALAVLATPLEGHTFDISNISSRIGQAVTALGYPEGEPLGLTQGHIAKKYSGNGIAQLDISLLAVGGESGGPIVGSDGRVVAIAQFGTPERTYSVDLYRFTAGDPAQLCLGAIASLPSTVCASPRRRAARVSTEGAPALCRGVLSDLPFASCRVLSPEMLAVLRIHSVCSDYSVNGSGFLVGPKLVMTVSHLLVDKRDGSPCKITLYQDAIGTSAAMTGSTMFETSPGAAGINVAVVSLDHALEGKPFTFGRSGVSVGQPIRAVDYAIGTLTARISELTPLYREQVASAGKGRVTRLYKSWGVKQFEIDADVPGGQAGGPILNLSGEVVGLVGSFNARSRRVYSIDLARITGGDAHQLCVDPGVESSSTMCAGGSRASSVLQASHVVIACDSEAAIPPFTYCAIITDTPHVTPFSPVYDADLAIDSCWVATKDSYDAGDKTAVVPISSPKLYLNWVFNQMIPGTTIAFTATRPNGSADLVYQGEMFLGASTSLAWRSAPYTLQGPAPLDGTWTFAITITKPRNVTSTCTTSVTVTPAS